MRYLILCHADDGLALRVYRALSHRHGQGAVQLIAAEALAMAPSWVHLLAPSAVTRITLADGAVLDSGDGVLVFNRLRNAIPLHFTSAAPADRDYAASEMHALWLSWLAGLEAARPGSVINPATGRGLGTPERSQLEWLWLADRAGLPVVEYCAGAGSLSEPEGSGPPDTKITPVDTVPINLLLAGDEHVWLPLEGFAKPKYLPDTRALALPLQALQSLSGCPLLEARFVSSENDQDWRISQVESFPQIEVPAAVQAIVHMMETPSRRNVPLVRLPSTDRMTPQRGVSTTGRAQRMILLCGIPSEPPLRLVVEAARRLGRPAIVFNQRRSLDIELQVNAGNPDGAWALEGRLAIDHQVYPLSVFFGIYNRLMDYQSLPEFKAEAARAQIANLHGLFSAWLEVAPARVMNRFSAMSSNLSKPYQLQLIAQAGFLIPPTLITNDPDEARVFIAAHGRAVYKSISSVRSVVGEVQRPGAASLEKIRYLPTQFQALIPGQDVRVHVVGEQVFATRITSSAVDYRYAAASGRDVEMLAIELEQDVQALCLDLARWLNLPLCGIDLRLTPAGDWYCFEANPSPAFSYYQEGAGQDIASAIVTYLAHM